MPQIVQVKLNFFLIREPAIAVNRTDSILTSRNILSNIRNKIDLRLSGEWERLYENCPVFTVFWAITIGLRSNVAFSLRSKN